MKVLILYYSGVGNTKIVAEKIDVLLNKHCQVSLYSIENLSNQLDLNSYDALIVGFPTIHASPAMPIMRFIDQLAPMSKPTPVFLFTTCGLFSANTLRIFAKKCQRVRLLPILSRSYRCAATDGILVAPFMPIWFRNEKNLDAKITKDVVYFEQLLKTKIKLVIPRFQFISILNYPNKMAGQHFSPTLYVHQDKCITCGKCIASCPESSISQDNQGYPFIDKEKCIHCYRCIHHCPQKAISLSKKRTPQKTLYY